MNIAIIPARGGSKRIPRKNIRNFCGKPMIAWAINIAMKSGLFERVIVSTDDDEISSISRSLGAETPFVRPSNLADDLTPTVPVVAHAVKSCIDSGWVADYFCCIYPCVPFMQVSDLISALELVKLKNADFAFPVTKYAHPIQRAMRLLPNGKMQFLSAKHELARTQDLEDTYHDAGQFYWGGSNAWVEQKKMHSSGLGISIPSWRVVDIDNEEDWRRAELIFHSMGVVSETGSTGKQVQI